MAVRTEDKLSVQHTDLMFHHDIDNRLCAGIFVVVVVV